jgi:hypothetical protein
MISCADSLGLDPILYHLVGLSSTEALVLAYGQNKRPQPAAIHKALKTSNALVSLNRKPFSQIARR